ncbi:MAG: tripartite tricarboxylate transporter substrate binding protein [Betaproteobacteria bacterium]|jgi:tripartite-type tricarboxylate transporter receptor subunit TctC|nr:tripartite tricarboxylate transporter substrate binding protein [Betaproteobacteria bacterium]
MRTRTALFAAALGAACVASAAALAQGYPERPVRVVVPFAPGGATDIIARIVGQKLGERLGGQVVIENKPGAGTTLGNAEVAKAKPDGHTLLFAPTPFVISQVVYPSLPYDAAKDFAPVSLLATSPFILVVNQGVPARSVGELVALAKAKPGTLNFGSAGNGTVPHLAGELFKLRAGVDVVHVPYKGGGPAIVDLVGGQVSMMFATPIEVSQHVQAGRLQVLGATSLKRLSAFPDVPTLDESGYPGFEVLSFFGVLAPAGTPQPILDRLAKELAAVMELPDVRERFAAQSAEANVRPGAVFSRFLADEREKWADLVKRSGAKVD